MQPSQLIAVVDTETTGLYPTAHDRVIEVAALLMTPTGSIVDRFETLTNPKRDLGPTHLHNIRAEEVVHAPHFEDIAGDLIEFLSPAGLIVGHNLMFDLRFLRAELARLGIQFDWSPPTVDTYRETRLRLEEACIQYDVTTNFNFHAAMVDVEATRLLALQLQAEGVIDLSSNHHDLGLPEIPALKAERVTRQAAKNLNRSGSGFLSTLAEQVVYSLPSSANVKGDYFCLLSAALEDRILSEKETEILRAFAYDYALSAPDVRTLHLEFLEQMVEVAWADKIFTEHEINDLGRLRRLLDLTEEDLASTIEKVKSRATESLANPEKGVATSLANKTVCFTGAIISSLSGEAITRALAHELAESAGLIIKNGVTKKLDILVIADPDSQSGKAKKARDYGTRIIAERDFWGMIGVEIS